jgi:hypothetical protein
MNERNFVPASVPGAAVSDVRITSRGAFPENADAPNKPAAKRPTGTIVFRKTLLLALYAAGCGRSVFA